MERRSIEIDAVWDIEAQNWDQFVVGGIRKKDGSYHEFRHRREDDFVAFLLEQEGTIWAHFGGGYDFKWFLDKAAKFNIGGMLTVAGSRIISIELPKLLLCDSYALAPMKLKDFTKGLGVSKEELDLPCTCGDDCGGYCGIRRDMPLSHWRRVCQYLEADCESLWQALHTLRDFAAEHDLDLGRTIGSSAFRNVQRTLGLKSADPAKGGLTEVKYRFGRKGYYGGRTQLYIRSYFQDDEPETQDTHVEGLEQWQGRDQWNIVPIAEAHASDVSSMYPWTLKTFAVPYGASSMLYGRDAKVAFEKPRPGIYRAIVNVPDMHIPPLPRRFNKGKSIAYPTGQFVGTWTAPELRWAMERGATVDITEGLLWQTELCLFREWIDKLWKLRSGLPAITTANGKTIEGKKTPMGIWLKLYMNSLTGKFGSNPERDAYLYNPRTLVFCECKCGRCRKLLRKCRCAREDIMAPKCPCRPYRQVSDSVWTRPSWRIEDCAHIQIASYLTSYARVELNRAQLSDGQDGRTVIYSDTDSIYGLLKLLRRIGDELGEWKYEGVVRDFIGIAPKVYSYRDEKGETIGKAKGVPLGKGERPQIGRPYSKDGVLGFKAGLKANQLFKKRDDFTRTLSPRSGDRIIVPGSRYTRAPRADELKLDIE